VSMYPSYGTFTLVVTAEDGPDGISALRPA